MAASFSFLAARHRRGLRQSDYDEADADADTGTDTDADADDEEAQLSSRDRESSFDSELEEDGSPIDGDGAVDQPPSIVEIPLPSLSIDARAEDVHTITSMLGNIKDPTIKTALEKIIREPEHARQYCNHIRCGSGSDVWPAIDILYDGLIFAGFDPKRLAKNNTRRKTEWFRAFYGVDHTTAAPYLADLRKENPDIQFRDCLMTMNWLACYDTLPVLTARWGCCEEYIGPKVWSYCEKMAALAREKITFALEHDVELGYTVDCATFMVREMRLDPSSEWFDWKTHSCGLVSDYTFLSRE